MVLIGKSMAVSKGPALFLKFRPIIAYEKNMRQVNKIRISAIINFA